MKAYLVANPTPIPPFRKPASQLRFREGTFAERLRTQLADAGFEIAPKVSLGPHVSEGVEPGSLVLGDDLVVSNDFFRRFIKEIPNRAKSYQCEIDAGRFALLSPKEAPESFRALPLFYYGDPRGKVAPLRLKPKTVHEVVQGLPPRMHMARDLCAYFSDFYAIDIKYWFDIQTATSLYCREYVSDLVGPLHRFCPDWLRLRLTSWTWLMERCNSIGRRTRIHPTAILEGCVVGDDVDIGPFTYLRSCVIGNGAVIRERTTMKTAYFGEGAFVMGSDVVNSYVGAESSIITPMLYNVVFGERSFISGGSGFADFNLGSGQISASIDGQDVRSNLIFLGSAVGDDCFLGANLFFAPGRTIPDGTRLLDHGLIKSVPEAGGGSYVLSGNRLLQVPDSFLGGKG